ncbi:cytochrome c nitrite reductase small subunit [Fibrobacterota bacterium]
MVLGAALGSGIFTFLYGEGFSYFSKDPAACVNCHIMQPQYDSWQKSSHHSAAVCVDCHLPHSFFPKWVAKAENGFRHSKGFTFLDFPEPIFIGRKNRTVLQENCLNCHAELVQHITGYNSGVSDCLHCHQGAGHGEYAGLGKFTIEAEFINPGEMR